MKTLVSVTSIMLMLLFAGCISLGRGPHKAYNRIVKHDITFDAIIVPASLTTAKYGTL